MKQSFSRFFGIVETKEATEESEETVEASETNEQEKIMRIALEDIVPNRFQPRTVFDEEKIEELAQTIHTHGIIQPIVVRENEGNKFEIIAGERRWRAVTKLGWDTIPSIIKNLNDTETASVALIENLQREELSPIEEAVAYSELLKLHNLTQEALAQRLGKGQSTVANKLRLLKLTEQVQTALLNKEISERHARALISLDEEQQAQMLEEIIKNKLNVKQTEDKVNKLQTKKPKKNRQKKKAFTKDMRIALNTIRHSLTMVNESGISLDSEEEEFEDYYQFTIRIPKNK